MDVFQQLDDYDQYILLEEEQRYVLSSLLFILYSENILRVALY